jgi:predicted nucleic acid-binding Zn ribbon protein
MMKEPIDVMLHLNPSKLPAEVFERATAYSQRRRNWRQRQQEAWESFGKPGRDPDRLGGVMGSIASAGEWTPHLRLAQLRTHWDQVVGSAIAMHSDVAGFSDGVLTIRAESNTWATQLSYLIPQLTETIRQRLQGLEVREIRVTGPQSHRFHGAGSSGRRIRRS